ncbi:acyl-CoA thioesterase [Xylocopilactobacillus apicola]|uniref:HotDog ACOT-type domain-containing protein n=1 Tax=Xylocopilactobacillus apicola TaxID=2932184 RepID=A0AAU9CZF1_9LACO|nr:hotdog domain-containing protein [Xylocopilactobacillus apicola]BDR59392.1 hypothetical protein XA3_18330 [Xylocopilactobacillus apicola]
MSKQIKISDTITITTNHVMPNQLNGHNTMFGGEILSLIDRTAAISANLVTKEPIATVSLDEVNFIKPILPNSIYTLTCYASGTDDRSIEVFFKIKARELKENQMQTKVTGFITFALLNSATLDLELHPTNPEEEYVLDHFTARLEKRGIKIANLRDLLKIID